MQKTQRRTILDRHEQTLRGRLRSCRIYSTYLCLIKSLYIYEPPGLKDLHNYPIVYLFRGHEREWVNIQEDSSRVSSTAIEDIDTLISLGHLPPMVAIMPGLNSNNNHIPSLGIDMKGKWPSKQRGLGTGRFWKYLTREVFPWVARKYPKGSLDHRFAVGFSLGGYTVSLLGIHHPGYFKHLGIYDGLFMWARYEDPRIDPMQHYNDRVWLQNPLFDAAFGTPRKKRALNSWNPTDTLVNANNSLLDTLRQSTWWIQSATDDGNQGNKDRTQYYVDQLRRADIPLGFDTIVFHDNASHSWHWTDRFLIHFLSQVLT